MSEVLTWIACAVALLLAVDKLLGLGAKTARELKHAELALKLEGAQRRVEQLEKGLEVVCNVVRGHERGKEWADAILDVSHAQASDEVHAVISQGLATGKVSS